MIRFAWQAQGPPPHLVTTVAGGVLNLIVIGCEYAGKTTLALGISRWMIESMGLNMVVWHDHYVVPRSASSSTSEGGHLTIMRPGADAPDTPYGAHVRPGADAPDTPTAPTSSGRRTRRTSATPSCSMRCSG